MVSAPTLIMSAYSVLQNIRLANPLDNNIYFSDIITKLRFPPQLHFSHLEKQKIDKFMDEHHLDPSQRQAFVMAQSQQLSLIQGPPGTGKSHIARLICKYNLSTHPHGSYKILLVTYKNLSLDHLCQGCVGFLPNKKDDILRLGSKSTCADLFTVMEDKTAKRRATVKIGAQCEAVENILDQIRDLLSAISRVIQPDVRLLSAQERGSLMSEGWSNHPDKVFHLEWLRTRKQNQRPEKRKDVVDNVLQAFGMDKRVEEDDTEDNTEQEVAAQMQKLSLNPALAVNLNHAAEDTAKGREITPEEEEEGKIWEQLDEKYELREETKAVMKSLYDSELIDLGSVFRALSRYPKGKAFAENVNLWNLDYQARQQFAIFIVRRFISNILRQLGELLLNYQRAQSELFEASAMRKASIASHFPVTGATISGIALNADFVNKMDPQLIIVEEAAEILEGNVLGSILVGSRATKVPKIVLIGDHEQLRPQNDCHRLTQEKAFNVSLFERLIRNNAPFVTLTHQRRMHPSLTRIHSWIYGENKIVDGVKDDERSIISNNICPISKKPLGYYTYLPGLRYAKDGMLVLSRKLFLAVNSQEERKGISPDNPIEAKMAVSYANYLVHHVGIAASKITILAPYKGQLFTIRKITMPYQKEFRVDSQTVDNFQGEENDIIILCLTRTSRIGFLQMQNRICVAVSRARCGFVMIGNIKLYNKNETWAKVLNKVDVTSVEPSDTLPQAALVCPRHLQSAKLLHKIDYTASNLRWKSQICDQKCGVVCVRDHACKEQCHDCPGCSVLGDYDLPCGHAYHGRCSAPPLCEMMVAVKLACSHSALRQCHSIDTPACTTDVMKTLFCGHIQAVRCSVQVHDGMCQSKCGKICAAGLHKCQKICHPELCAACLKHKNVVLACGHQATVMCSEVKLPLCNVVVCKQKSCGHELNVNCCVNVENEACRHMVSKLLFCGHHKELQCSEVVTEGIVCHAQVNKKLLCGHTVNTPCHTTPECRHPAQKNLTCGHTIATFCGADIKDLKCAEKVTKLKPCGMHTFEDLCSSASVPACREPIVKTLACGHEARKMCSAEDPKCATTITERRQCGHEYNGVCGGLCRENTLRMLLCGHVSPAECSKPYSTITCNSQVDHVYPCNHTNKVLCGAARAKKLPPCVQNVERVLLCGHPAIMKCNEPVLKAVCKTLVTQYGACGCPVYVPCSERATKAAQCEACQKKHDVMRAKFAQHATEHTLPLQDLSPYAFDINACINTLNARVGNFRLGLKQDVLHQIRTENFMKFCSTMADPMQMIRVLVPVKSIRFLQVTLRRGFPPPFPDKEPVCKLHLDKKLFDVRNRGRRLAMQCLVALGSKDKDFKVSPKTKIEDLQLKYMLGQISVCLYNPNQILIESVIEI